MILLVYADRGWHGGFSLLPGLRTELTGLNHEEALALLPAGSGSGEKVFGLSSALASATRKVVDALPEGHRAGLDDAARRFLVEPETDLRSRRVVTEDVATGGMGVVRWAERSAQFLSENHLPVLVRVDPARREELLSSTRAVRAGEAEADG